MRNLREIFLHCEILYGWSLIRNIFQIEFDFSRSTSALAWLNERERPKRTILFARDVCEQTMAKEGLSDFI